MEIIDKLKYRYQSSSVLLRLIYINIAVFVVLRLLVLVSFILNIEIDSILQWVELPSNFAVLLTRPWTVLTYMFVHYELLHILFNMLWLFWLGRLFLDCFSPRQLGGLYVMGGLAGAFLYLLTFNLLPHLSHTFMLGASASVLAIVIAIAVYRPNYQIGLMFIGSISLKWIALITILLDVIGIGDGNIGGHIAHVGGMFMGMWFALSIKRGHDITSWLNRCIDAVVSKFKKTPRGPGQPMGGRRYNYHSSTQATTGTGSNNSSFPNEEQIDEILKKLKQSGYDGLSDKEKEILFNASSKR